jgi:hypothetical protein
VDLQAEGAAPARHRLADAAHADDAEPLSADAMAEHPGRRPARPVLAFGEDRGALDQPPRHRQDSAMVMSAVSSVENLRRIGHGDAARNRGGNVDIVDAVAEIGDQLAACSRLLEEYLP